MSILTACHYPPEGSDQFVLGEVLTAMFVVHVKMSFFFNNDKEASQLSVHL